MSLDHGVYMLLDTSGTYTRELEQAERIINYILAELKPGDSFAVASIDTASFSERDIWFKKTFDDRPSRTNAQKREFRDVIVATMKKVRPSRYTDITGGLLQAVEYLNERNPGKRTIIIFSDLKEEIPAGYVRDIPLQLNGFNVIAVNVTKLRSDNVDPREYLDRLEDWRRKVEEGGGTWQVINDLDRLESIFASG
ncbi:MAG TPA: VWA domain-containing protein [Gammaproteobacteria bacterium]|nr:VWA domain-containing protein [Gammaproteobacteria bacterium]